VLAALVVVLACILAVQHIPQAGKIYDYVAEDLLGLKKVHKQTAEPAPVEDIAVVAIGGEEVRVPREVDLGDVEAYTRAIRRIFCQTNQAAMGVPGERGKDEGK